MILLSIVECVPKVLLVVVVVFPLGFLLSLIPIGLAVRSLEAHYYRSEPGKVQWVACFRFCECQARFVREAKTKHSKLLPLLKIMN